MVSSPALHRLALQRKYSDFIERVKSHPEDVTWTDRYGNNPLHLLCAAQQQRDDLLLLKAVESIINVNPAMIAQPNHVGWTPMHHASTKRLSLRPIHNYDVLLLLMERCPSAVSIPSRAGYKRMTPFHIACCEANADYVILKRMLEIDPSLATRPCVEQEAYAMSESPISLIWKHLAVGISVSTNKKDTLKRDVFDKMSLLLLVAYHGRVVEPNHGHRFLLHAACCQRVPRAYISHLLSSQSNNEIIRQQARVVDERGNLPLHYAVQTASVDCQLYTQFLIQSLLQVYPEAARQRDAHGRLPLHVAIQDSHMTWHKGGVKELVYAYPDALVSRDEQSKGLYAFMTSAPQAISSRLHLTTTYELLLAAPEMIKAGTIIQEEE
jgi:ankyrin repeat protein